MLPYPLDSTMCSRLLLHPIIICLRNRHQMPIRSQILDRHNHKCPFLSLLVSLQYLLLVPRAQNLHLRPLNRIRNRIQNLLSLKALFFEHEPRQVKITQTLGWLCCLGIFSLILFVKCLRLCNHVFVNT